MLKNMHTKAQEHVFDCGGWGRVTSYLLGVAVGVWGRALKKSSTIAPLDCKISPVERQNASSLRIQEKPA